jgi:putative FmdB family regulatory protein
MPIFRYQCRSCQAEFELLLPRFDSDAECPECGSADLEKQLNKVAVGSSSASRGCAMSSQCPAASASGCCCAGSCHHNH